MESKTIQVAVVVNVVALLGTEASMEIKRGDSGYSGFHDRCLIFGTTMKRIDVILTMTLSCRGASGYDDSTLATLPVMEQHLVSMRWKFE